MKTTRSRSPTKEQLSASSPEHSVWVSANAGSGKTQVLVDRVIKLLLSGAEPASILCITFTKAAAAEMSQRLFDRLSSWTAFDDGALSSTISELGMKVESAILNRARQLFTLALETPGGLKIQTIHGFCERLLHLFPVEAGLAPGFSVIEDGQAREIRDAAIADVLLNPLALPQITQAVDEIKAWVSGMEGFAELVTEFLGIISKNTAFRDGQLTRREFEHALKLILNLNAQRKADSLKSEAVDIDAEKYERFGKNLERFGNFKSQPTPALLINIAKSEDRWENLRNLFLTVKLEPFKQMISKDAGKTYPDALTFLAEEQQRFYELFRQYHSARRVEASGALFEVAKSVRERIEFRKRRAGLCDFDDLIERTSALLTGNQATAWVLYKLDNGLNHILVDEAQDTSPPQWQIIRALADEFFSGQGKERQALRTMFVVGDRKQSIYSFQGADLRAYNETRDYLTSRLDQSGGRLAEEKLGLSFRSAQQILDAIDRVFPISDLTLMGLGGPSHEESPHSSARLDTEGIVELWPLVVSEKRRSEDDEAWTTPVDEIGETHHRRQLAQKIAATLKNWIGRRALAGETRLVAAGDILILLQSRTGLFPLLLAEMRRLNLPVAGADRLTLQKSLAVQDLMMFVQWCLVPQDDYALACILKSPLIPFALTEEELFALAHDRGNLALWEVMNKESTPNTAMLGKFLELSVSASPASFLHQLLNQSRKRIVGRLGSEALEATDALLDLAYEFESNRAGGLFAFTAWFEAGETTLKREMEQASDQIRVMSVHAAKGLEANIVILPDAAYVAGGGQPSNFLQTDATSSFPYLPLWNLSGLPRNDELMAWVENEKRRAREERNRLLYVAMTRARNELYITGSSSGGAIPEHCWWNRLVDSLGEGLIKQPDLLDETMDTAEGPDIATVQPVPLWAADPLPGSANDRAKVEKNVPEEETEAQKRGTALHRLMQLLVECPSPARQDVAASFMAQTKLPPGDIGKLMSLFDRPELEPFWTAEGRSEVEIWSKQAKSQSRIMRIDRLVLASQETLILDYKAGNPSGQQIHQDHPYVAQMARYADAIQDVRPEKPVRAALLWLETGKLEWLPPEWLSQSLDRPATPNVVSAS